MSEPQPTSRSVFARHRVGFTVGAAAIVFVLLATGALFAGASVGSSKKPVTAQTSSSAPVVAQRVVPVTLPDGNPIRTCTVAALAKDPRLATFEGYVTNLDTGDVLFDRGGTVPARTGSVLKLVTASVALQILGPDYRMTTTVVAGATPGTVVLVGGGDPTLSRQTKSVYPDAPRLSDLAAQVKAVVDPAVPITNIVLDSTYWDSADKWDSTWKRTEQTTGYLSEVTALQVDGDRKDPTKQVSPRSTDPVTAAGTWFAKALGVPDAVLTLGTAPAGAQVLGTVQSRPVSDLINTMLLTSDGTLGEALARVTSKVSGANGSRASLQDVMSTALTKLGLNPADVGVYDGSGLSEKNAVSPRFITQLIALLKEGKNHLDVVYKGLSQAGKTGSLKDRFTGANAIARGHVLAKTGWIDTEYSLAGVVTAKDASSLAFAFYAIGPKVTANAKVALDTLTTAIYTCGNNLSNR